MLFDSSVPTRSLYIHWPFCPYKCHFCPFVALAGHDQFMPQYHAALVKEIEMFFEGQPYQQWDTIFFGGGTPSTYPTDLLLDTFGILNKRGEISDRTEISLEVNPGTVKPGVLEVWRQLGINRLSIGVQSTKDGVLKALNRHQKATDVHELLDQARLLFDNLSVDLILGLPGVSSDEWKDLIERVVDWPINHVSIYFLTIHENTPLYFKIQKNEVEIPADDSIIPLFYWTIDRLEKAGLYQYELSNFARPGFESKHNSGYWSRVPYKGFGIGACSFDGRSRFQNEKNLMKYIGSLQSGVLPSCTQEDLAEDQVNLEILMLGLRRREGVARNELIAVSGRPKKQVEDFLLLAVEKGWLFEVDSRIKLTPSGMLIENEIITQLVRE